MTREFLLCGQFPRLQVNVDDQIITFFLGFSAFFTFPGLLFSAASEFLIQFLSFEIVSKKKIKKIPNMSHLGSSLILSF